MLKMRRKKRNYPIIIAIVLLLGLIVWNYHSSWLVSQLSIETAHQGWVKHEKQVKAVFANTESVLTAAAEGKVTLIQTEGRRFKIGETVAKIIPTGVDHGSSKEEVKVTAPFSGLFYSYRDGLEQVITPENLMNLDLNGLLAQVNNFQQPSAAENSLVSKNSPIGKMVNNLYPSWAFVYLETTDTMVKDDTFKFIVEEEEYVGTVMKLSGTPRGAIVRFPQYVKGTTENRIIEIIWNNKSSSKGLVVPASSVCTYGEERGVYIRDEGVIRFRSVKVVDSNDQLACVEGLPEGVQIITNPRKGIEGLTMKL